MKTVRTKELIREEDFMLEVDVEARVGEPDDPWSPCYSIAVAQRLYEARIAMKNRDWAKAASYGRLYRLEPVPLSELAVSA